MALVSFGGTILYPEPQFTSGVSFALRGTTIDAADEKVGVVFKAIKAGTIAKVVVSCGAGTPANAMTVRLETVSPTTGYPTGTLIATGAEGTFTYAANTNVLAVINTPPTVAIGDMIAIVFGFSSWNSGESCVFANQADITQNAQNLPYAVAYVGAPSAAWAKGNGSTFYPPNFAVKYGDGTFVSAPNWAASGLKAMTEITHSTSSNPDHYGNKFRLPFNAQVVGFWSLMRKDGDSEVILYDSDGSTALRTVALDKDQFGSTTGGIAVYFGSPITLTKNTWYRISHHPTTTTSCRSYYIVGVDDGSDAWLTALAGGTDIHMTTCDGAPANDAAWTNTATQRVMIGLLIDQLDDGAGGGGGLLTHPGMAGGMRG